MTFLLFFIFCNPVFLTFLSFSCSLPSSTPRLLFNLLLDLSFHGISYFLSLLELFLFLTFLFFVAILVLILFSIFIFCLFPLFPSSSVCHYFSVSSSLFSHSASSFYSCLYLYSCYCSSKYSSPFSYSSSSFSL